MKIKENKKRNGKINDSNNTITGLRQMNLRKEESMWRIHPRDNQRQVVDGALLPARLLQGARFA